MDIYLICGLLIGVLVTIAVAVGAWVYKDANERGLNGTVWALVVVLTWGLWCWILSGHADGEEVTFRSTGGIHSTGALPII